MFKAFFQKLLTGPLGTGRRHQLRFPYEAITLFSNEEQHTFRCGIVNVSKYGMCIRTDTTIKVGWIIRLHSPSLTAEVVWVEEGMAGLLFVEGDIDSMLVHD
jgi:PilZ domain